MDKPTALNLINQYADRLAAWAARPHGRWAHEQSSVERTLWETVHDAIGMPDRWPEDGSERKAMRWLGYMQGVAVACGLFTLDEVKEHSRRGYV